MDGIKKVKELANELLALCRNQVDGGAEISGGRGWGSSIAFEEGRLKTIKSAQTSSIALRIIHKGKIGVSGSTRIGKKEIKDILTDAKNVSRFGKKADFDFPFPCKANKPRLFDTRICQIREGDLIEKGERIIQRIKDKGLEMKVNSLGFSYGWGENYFTNSKGILSEQKGTSNSFSLEISKIKEGDFFQLNIGQDSRCDDIDITDLTNRLLEEVSWGKRIAKVKQGLCPIIFSPRSVSVLLSYLITNLSGKTVNEGSSKFKDKLGRKLFDSRLTLFDDPTLDYYPSSYSLDDEGIPGKMKVLIKNGVVNNFYYDLSQAAKAGTKSTGNGSRGGLFSQASPGVSNLAVAAGEKNFLELVKETSEGILVYDFLGAGQDNPFNGDFQLNLSLAYKIENGEIVGRLKNTSIAGNVFDLLRSKLMWLSKDKERWGSLYSPYICLDEVVVTSDL